MPSIPEKKDLFLAHAAAGDAVVVAVYFGVNPPEHIREMIETIRVPRNLDAGTGKKPNQTD